MTTRTLAAAVALALAAGTMLAACSSRPPAPPVARVEPPALTDDKPRDYPGLHNVVAYHPGFISGGAPEGAAAFDTLAAMGIKTIISVDGAETEVDKARARGMRYIHLPIGYNGFDEPRRLELARAVRDAIKDGPVYIHCHHGKHRSAGAAGSIAVSLGWMTGEQAVARMKVSGTAPNYTGLYACTASAGMISDAALDAVKADFPELARPQGLVKGMLDIDAALDNLKAIEKAGWTAPADHPDLVPASEAGKLMDLLRYLESDEHVKAKPEGFQALLRENTERAGALEEMLASGKPDPARLSAQFKLVAASCKDCHAKHRD